MDKDTKETLILIAAVLSGAQAAIELSERILRQIKNSKKAHKRPKPNKQRRK